MINLIPPVARKKVKLEYWSRAVSVWMILAASALIMVALLKLPVYVMVQDQLEVFSSSYQDAADSDQQFKQSEQLIKDANEISSILSGGEESFLFSSVIKKIHGLAPEGIEISEFALSREKGQVKNVLVSGSSDTRHDLAKFKEAIEADEMFISAELPISNLAKDVDIPFKINIEPDIPNSDHDS